MRLTSSRSAWRSCGERRTRADRREPRLERRQVRPRRAGGLHLHGLPAAQLDDAPTPRALLERGKSPPARTPGTRRTAARSRRGGASANPPSHTSRTSMPREGAAPAAKPQRLGHRDRGDERRQRRNDAHRVAGRAGSRRRERLEVAAQARRLLRDGQRDAPLRADARRVQVRHAERPRRVRDEEPRLEVVGAVEDEVVAGEQLPRVPESRSATTGSTDRDGSISSSRAGRGLGLGRHAGRVVRVEEELPREVRRLDDVAVDQRQAPEARARRLLRRRRARRRRRRRTRSRSAPIRRCPSSPIPGKSTERE